MKLRLSAVPLIIQALAVILCIVSVVVPRWLANDVGTLLHPHGRSWGLLYVVGRQKRSHTTQWKIACQSVGKFYIISCESPLCIWYSQKCAAFRIIAIISYTVLSLIVLSIILNCFSIFLSSRHSQKTLRYSVGLAFFSSFFCCISAFIYIYGMDVAFGMINSAGYYPVPQPAFSFITFCISIFFSVVGLIYRAVQLSRISREANYIKSTRSEIQKIRSQYHE